jgi:hypothetical protein
MRSPTAPSALTCAPLFLLGVAFCSACDETPRGDQGIDFLDDAGYYNVPPTPEAGPDAHGPCANETDPTGICAQASVTGIPASVLVSCTDSTPPVGITCVSTGNAVDGGATAYCCTTGIL